MYKPAYTKEENLRLECLDKAILATNNDGLYNTTERLIEKAKEFEKYVLSGEGTDGSAG